MQIFVFTVWGGSYTLSSAFQRSPFTLSSLDFISCGNPSHMAPTYISLAELLNRAVKQGEPAYICDPLTIDPQVQLSQPVNSITGCRNC